jgi:hypothetical protein
MEKYVEQYQAWGGGLSLPIWPDVQGWQEGNFSINWLRVLGTAERSQVDQRVRHHLHAIVPLLEAFKAEQHPLELVFPRKRPLDAHASRMDGGVEQPLPPTFGVLAVARILWDVRDHTGIENALPIPCGIKAAVEIDLSASAVQPDLFGHWLQGVQTLGQQDHVRLIDRCHGKGSPHIPIVVGHGKDLLPFLRLVARVANASTPFLATVLVPSSWSTLVSRCFSAERGATLAMPACHSDPSAAHLAKAR